MNHKISISFLEYLRYLYWEGTEICIWNFYRRLSAEMPCQSICICILSICSRVLVCALARMMTDHKVSVDGSWDISITPTLVIIIVIINIIKIICILNEINTPANNILEYQCHCQHVIPPYRQIINVILASF